MFFPCCFVVSSASDSMNLLLRRYESCFKRSQKKKYKILSTTRLITAKIHRFFDSFTSKTKIISLSRLKMSITNLFQNKSTKIEQNVFSLMPFPEKTFILKSTKTQKLFILKKAQVCFVPSLYPCFLSSHPSLYPRFLLPCVFD
ncbi:hypothetical protein NQD34_005924 [Periophthalmus magnuspinnatus]|nr:hypothetical protein NQD34_005924 [Periophthalmus magnuspinnatus]